MARGNAPRSFKFPNGDSHLSTPMKTNAYLYDTALAIMGTVKLNPALAYEITNKAIVALYNTYDDPTVINHEDSSHNSFSETSNGLAMMAYAIGFYLEQYPSTPNSCAIIDMLRKILHELESFRDFVSYSGLIKAGIDEAGVELTFVKSVDNILAYFAFRQAGYVLNDSNYTATSNELKTAMLDIYSGQAVNGFTAMWADKPNMYSFDYTFELMGQVMAVLFFKAIGGLSAEITNILAIIENNSCVDTNNGANGYSRLPAEGKVWFEGSYAVALMYYQLGQTTTYNNIVKELNKFIDATDGGQIGGLVKDVAEDESLYAYKSVGATGWALVARAMKTQAFIFTSGFASPYACPIPYFNGIQSQGFNKSDCGSGLTPSTVTYTVRSGRYMSWIDQPTADQFALDEIAANGQAYADLNGTCTGTVGNEVQSQVFYNSSCPAGTADAYTYTVAANTYYAGTLTDANNMALADIASNGQNQANLYGSCSTPTLTINLIATVNDVPNGSTDSIYIEVDADHVVTQDIHVAVMLSLGGGNYSILCPDYVIYTGTTTSGQLYVGEVAPLGSADVTITTVSPNPDSSGTTYTF